jgi:hypothetical protein
VTVARARHYPDPLPAATVLAAARCDHGELIGRCPLCRLAAEPGDDQAPPEPTRPQPARRRATGHADQDTASPSAERPAATTAQPAGERYAEDDPRSVDWWAR